MNIKNILIGLAVIVVSLAGGVIGARYFTPTTGGSFAGGITPSNLFTGSTSGGGSGNGYVQPNGSFELVGSNGVGIGGTSQYNDEQYEVTASGTPLAAGATLGPLGSTTSTATTSITLSNVTGLAIGDICSGGIATATAYISGCVLTSTNGVTGTALAAYTNITASAITVVSTTRINVSFEHLPY